MAWFFHARDAFISSSSCLEAELHIIEWTLRSLVYLRLQDVELLSVALTAIKEAQKWPRFRLHIDHIWRLARIFHNLKWCYSHLKANLVGVILLGVLLEIIHFDRWSGLIAFTCGGKSAMSLVLKVLSCSGLIICYFLIRVKVLKAFSFSFNISLHVKKKVNIAK